MYCWLEGALVSAWLLLSPCSLFRGAESLLLLVRTGPQRHRSRAGDGSSIPLLPGLPGLCSTPGTPPGPLPPCATGDLRVLISVSLLGAEGGSGASLPRARGSELSTRAAQYFSGFLPVWNAWAG